MGKAPAFQFYVRDWLSDPQLRMCSHTTKGVWIDILCLMWEAPERGKLEGTIEQLRQAVASDNGDFQKFLDDAKSTKFCDVTVCNKNVTIINRRMLRDEKTKELTRLRVAKHRENKPSNANVTPPSSSSSSSSTSNTKKTHKKSEPKITLPEWMSVSVWKRFLDHRKSVKAPVGKEQYGHFFKKFEKWKSQGHEPEEVVNYMVDRGWRGFETDWVKNKEPQDAGTEFRRKHGLPV